MLLKLCLCKCYLLPCFVKSHHYCISFLIALIISLLTHCKIVGFVHSYEYSMLVLTSPSLFLSWSSILEILKASNPRAANTSRNRKSTTNACPGLIPIQPLLFPRLFILSWAGGKDQQGIRLGGWAESCCLPPPPPSTRNICGNG